jgi:hypothetical protein
MQKVSHDLRQPEDWRAYKGINLFLGETLAKWNEVD